MRVNIDEIKEGGLQRAWDLTRHAIDEMVTGDRAGVRAAAPLHVEASMVRTGRRVLLEVHARAALEGECVRCLGPLTLDVPIDFELTLVPEDEYESGPESAKDDAKAEMAGTFDAVGADEEVYRGKEIDLDPILREQVVLAMPAYPVCRESCKGLCTVCGANLNERDCGCERRVPDPRLAGLAKFKKQ
ncbi:MAG TPA: DUF177 domain-containing protein [Anaeromyxobacteraceae bacterium]|nr:DUF177 domain-containing protein [Anaeromyxobacteraceae bacterium]